MLLIIVEKRADVSRLRSLSRIQRGGPWDSIADRGFVRNLLGSLENHNMEESEKVLDANPLAVIEREVDGNEGGGLDFVIVANMGETTPLCSYGDEHCLFLKGIEDCNKEVLSEWVVSKLREFSPFMGLSYEECKKETMALFRLIKLKSKKGKGGCGARFARNNWLKMN